MYDAILVPTDGSERTNGAVAHGLALAKRYGATLHALYVVDIRALTGSDEDGGFDSPTLIESLHQRGTRATETIQHQATQTDVASVSAVETGTPAREIMQYTTDHDIDLIVMGTRGRSGLPRHILGSVTQTVVNNTSVPVLTAKQSIMPANPTYTDILLPYDGSKQARRIAEHVFDIASHYDATVHALSVLDTSLIQSADLLTVLERESEEALTDVKQAAKQAEIPIRTRVWKGSVVNSITQYTINHDIDLIGMANHDRRGLNRFLTRSVVERVIQLTETPVLSLRTQD